MHSLRKLNIGISSLILGALFLELNVSQVKADEIKNNANYSEQVNATVISKDNSSKKLVDKSNLETSLVSSSSDSQDKQGKSIENGENTLSTVKLQSNINSKQTPVNMSLYSVKEDNANKWSYNANRNTWSYIKKDGTEATQQWLQIKDKWYYFDKNGNMATNGWYDTSLPKDRSVKDSGKTYYFDKDGHYLTDHWTYEPYGKTWSYAKSNGMQANQEWLKKDNQWYYFDDDGNMAANGWWDTNLGNDHWKLYYFDKNGHYLTNHWTYNSDNNVWKYAKKDGTEANEEWLKMLDGHWYYFDVSGIMASSGWQWVSTKGNKFAEYYFDKNGHYLTNHWTYDSVDRTWSYAKNNGMRADDEWVKAKDNHWYYFDGDKMACNGVYDTSLFPGVTKYYFDKNGHFSSIHWVYALDKNGKPQRNHWVHDSINNIWSYTKYNGNQANKEWLKAPDGRWYYFDEAGVMASDGWKNTLLRNGKRVEYYFDKNGHYLINHWTYDSYGKTWSYAKNDGTQANEEWIKMSDGRWYYFDIMGIMASDRLLNTELKSGNSALYYFDKNGNYLTNRWAYDPYDKIWVYAKNDGIMAASEWLKLNDHWYYFLDGGAMVANGWCNTAPKNENLRVYYFDKNGHYSTNHWVYDTDDKTWSYAKDNGIRAAQEWVKVTGHWYYFDKNGNMVTDGWFDTYLGNGKWKKYYFDRNGHYLKN
ncbi:hypothetical protein [Lactobacillus taiwanensis]|uniref:hypothetical protein n=1 Tax=Lactobacillus taiwanensis TaxID=508451 RepID=UPI00272C00B6|nr:hypothetical protein [Lactobacillus taiwanensis]